MSPLMSAQITMLQRSLLQPAPCTANGRQAEPRRQWPSYELDANVLARLRTPHGGSCHCITSATQGGGQIVEGEDVHALQHDLKADSQGRLQFSHRSRTREGRNHCNYMPIWIMVTCESPLSVRFHELGPLPTPPNPPPNPYSHLSGPVCNRVMVIMFLCAWRLPSLHPRVVP